MPIYLQMMLFATSLTVAEAQEAQSPPSEQADQEALTAFSSAQDAYDAGNFDLAMRLFERSYELSGRPELLYNIASCAERLGERVRAREAYAAFVAALPDHDRARLARGRVEALTAETEEVEPTEHQHVGGDARLDLRVGLPLAGVGLAVASIGLIGLLTTDDCSDATPTGVCVERTVAATGPTAVYLTLGSLALVAGITWVIVGRSGAQDESSVSVSVGATGATVAGRW